MIFLFQVIEPATRIAEKGFQLDPTNIFQFLVGGLVLIILSLGSVIVIQYRRGIERENKIQELTVNITTVAVNATQVLESLAQQVDKLPTAIDNHKVEIKGAIKDSETNILRIVEAIKKNT